MPRRYRHSQRGSAAHNEEFMENCRLWTLRIVMGMPYFSRSVQKWAALDEQILELLNIDESSLVGMAVKDVRKKLSPALKALEESPPSAIGRVFENTALLSKALGLSDSEASVLVFAASSNCVRLLRELVECYCGAPLDQIFQLVSVACALPERTVRRILGSGSTLVGSGLIKLKDSNLDSSEPPLRIPEVLAVAMTDPHRNVESLLSNCFGKVKRSELVMNDFDHLGDDLNILFSYLRVAVKKKHKGVNILLYGAPGVGKTELARVVGRQMEANFYEVLVEDDDGRARSQYERIDSYRLCQSMMMKRKRALVLFDEAEDMFPVGYSFSFRPSRHSQGDKGWVVKLLENTAVPTIWIANQIGQMDDAYLRRFDVCLEIKVPPQEKRRKILQKSFSSLAVSEQWVRRMAKSEHLTPSDVEKAAKVLACMGETSSEENERIGERVLDTNLTARRLSIHPQHASRVESLYNIDFLNTDEDISAIAYGLSTKLKGSVLLYGPPGTGKTAFAFHIGEMSGKQVLARKSSDLLDMYVGGTEHNISAMFKQATSENAILLLDEADSFFRERRRAQQSWEVTQVNELLVQMENFHGLFICSTNLLGNLDQAVFRRFALKIKFDYLTQEQAVRLFIAHAEEMGMINKDDDLAPRQVQDALSSIICLTPGDYAAVRRRNELLGNLIDIPSFASELGKECRIKPAVRNETKIGFGR